jgi:hypothetical protein
MDRRSVYGIASGAFSLVHFAATLFIVIVVPLKLYSVSGASSSSGILGGSSRCALDISKNSPATATSGTSFCTVLVWFVIAACVVYSLASLVTSYIPLPALVSTVILVGTDVVLAFAWFVMFVLIVQHSNAASAAGVGAKGSRQGVATAAAVAGLAVICSGAIRVYALIVERRQKDNFRATAEPI